MFPYRTEDYKLTECNLSEKNLDTMETSDYDASSQQNSSQTKPSDNDALTNECNGTMFTAETSSDQDDVINGGDPIEFATIPAADQGQSRWVVCTLVSHPSHFYVKFVNKQHDQVLSEMTNFYNSEELIELPLDVLKPGQYFACTQTNGTDKQWIRVQLIHVDSHDAINCFLIDQGCVATVKLADLQPLYNNYRSIPKQAVRATLAGKLVVNLKQTNILWFD